MKGSGKRGSRTSRRSSTPPPPSSPPESPSGRKRKFQIASSFVELSRTGTVVLKPFSTFPELKRAAKTATSRHELVVDHAMPTNDVALGMHVLQQLKERFRSLKTANLNGPSHTWSKEEPIVAGQVQQLCECVTPLLLADASLVRIQGPTYIVGDLHGNYRDLKGFEKALFPLGISLATAHLLFLGDYVDRGPHSVEVALHLLALKAVAPSKITLLRGNHEDPEVNGDADTYGAGSFRTKCEELYGAEEGERVFDAINGAFAAMPIAALVENRIFCVHGGLPRRLETSTDILGDIESIKRPIDTVTDQLCLDLLWNDPVHTPAEKSALGTLPGFGKMFGPNARGPDVATFGREAVDRFLEQTGCLFIVRAHEKHDVGFGVQEGAKVLTVFSSSHYSGSNNQASIVLVLDGHLHVVLTKKE